MGLIERVKNILMKPKDEWAVIEGETSSTGDLLGGYVAPLAGIAALCGFVGSSLIGHSMPFVGTYRTPIFWGMGIAVLTFAMAFVSVFILTAIISALAPTFGGQKNSAQAMKVAVYAYTPAWVAGVLNLIPLLGILGIIAALYGIYLLYLGLPQLMKNPGEKSVAYTAVVVVCAIVVGFILSLIVGAFSMFAGGGMMGMMGASAPSAPVTFDRDSPMGKLEGFGKKMEEAGKKMEAAQKSGDANQQMAAAMEGLGTMLGGGKRYEPLALDVLKPMLPESVAGMPRKGQSSERGGPQGLEMAKAQSEYGDGASKSVRLEITDTGGAAGLMGLAGWAMAQGEKENDSRIERTRKEGDRLVHEKISKTGGSNELSIILGNRFMVEAQGRGVTMDELKAVVAGLDLKRLESMKDTGAK
jgi:uncharacterized membrane protein